MGSIILIVIALAIAVCLAPPVFTELVKLYSERLSAERFDKFSAVSMRVSIRKSIEDDLRRRLLLVLIIAIAGGGLSSFLFYTGERSEKISYLDRPEFGAGEKTYELWVQLNGEKTAIKVTPREQEPEEKEQQEFFDQIAAKAFEGALGGQSKDKITENLKLVDQINGADISWKLSSMKYMNSYGALRGDIPGSGSEVVLTADISYGGYERSYTLTLILFPKEIIKSEAEKLEDYVKKGIEEEAEKIYLPDRYEGTEISYELGTGEGYKTLAILAIAMVVICWLASEDALDKQYKRWESELIVDYPNILSRFSILLASGLSLAEGWKRMATEYEEQLTTGRKPSAGYEELLLSVRDMKNTGQVEKAIERFGIRCRERHYRKLSTLMIQSLNKGSISMAEQLKVEAGEAFELRKENARVMGERVRVQLMLPSFLLFGITIALVIYPAWAGL